MNKNTVKYVCPHCEKRYTLGINGTIHGCDECENVIRNKMDNTIIEEDTMTDMEKA